MVEVTCNGRTVVLDTIGVMDLIAGLTQSARIAGEEGFVGVQRRCNKAAETLRNTRW